MPQPLILPESIRATTAALYEVKSGWDEVTVREFADFHMRAAGAKPTQQLLIAAEMVSNVPHDVLKRDIALCKHIVDLCPWSKTEPADADDQPIYSITHAGQTFTYVGNLDTVSVGRYEGMLNYIELAGPAPMSAVPDLLGLLYCPADKVNDDEEPRQETVDATREAMATLPISQGYASIRFFFVNSTSLLVATRASIAAKSDAEKAASLLEELLTEKLVSAPRFTSLWSRLRTWVTREWVRFVLNHLRIS